MEGLIYVLVVVFAVVAILSSLASHRRRREIWAAFAEQHGLELDSGRFRLEGQVDGIDLFVERFTSGGKNKVIYGRAGARVPAPLSSQLTIGQEHLGHKLFDAFAQGDVQVGDPRLDGALRIYTPDEAKIAQVLTADPVRSRLLRAADWTASKVTLEHGELEIVRRGEPTGELDGRMREVLELAAALADAWEQPWRDFAGRRGWELTGQGLDRGRTIRGAVDGLRVSVRALFTTAGTRTEVAVELRHRLPGGLWVSLRTGGSVGGVELADPILGQLVYVKCADPDAARALLAVDEVRECLLAVVHGRPGSELGDGVITVRMDGMAVDLDGPVDDALALARALDRALARSAPDLA